MVAPSQYAHMPNDNQTSLVFPDIDQAFQTTIRLPLPLVYGNKDYRNREKLLLRMAEIIVTSGVESAFVTDALEREHAADVNQQVPFTDRRRDGVQQHARRSLRCTIARILSNESHRQFSCHLAESPLLRWFCHYGEVGVIRVPSKSTLQRMESSVPAAVMERVNALLLICASTIDGDGQSPVQLAEPIDLSVVWIDTTCAELDIHYPVDWALLRDGTRSIIRSIRVMRKHGLKHRMPEPSVFVAQMNQYSIAMTGASRKGRGGEKASSRKTVLRAMKRLAKKVIRHGRRYLALLLKYWKDTDLSEAQALDIAGRLERVLDLMPIAIKQAHERIIGERLVPTKKKLLSLYEPHARVYVRGKSGSDAEFGLQMILSESAEGLIVDCQLRPDDIAADATLLVPTLTRIKGTFGASAARAAVTDRGFSSAENSVKLMDLGIQDVTLPRSPKAMKKMLSKPHLRQLQKRRSQTEARIGIFKANFLGDNIPTKGLKAQQRYVAWATLAHNLWVLARLERISDVAANAA